MAHNLVTWEVYGDYWSLDDAFVVAKDELREWGDERFAKIHRVRAWRGIEPINAEAAHLIREQAETFLGIHEDGNHRFRLDECAIAIPVVHSSAGRGWHFVGCSHELTGEQYSMV